jgi:hypothetical protein
MQTSKTFKFSYALFFCAQGKRKKCLVFIFHNFEFIISHTFCINSFSSSGRKFSSVMG